MDYLVQEPKVVKTKAERKEFKGVICSECNKAVDPNILNQHLEKYCEKTKISAAVVLEQEQDVLRETTPEVDEIPQQDLVIIPEEPKSEVVEIVSELLEEIAKQVLSELNFRNFFFHILIFLKKMPKKLRFLD